MRPRFDGCAARTPRRIMFEGEDDHLIGARQGPPLAVGYGDGRDVSGLRRARARPLHRAHQLSRGGRLGGADARRRRHLATPSASRSSGPIQRVRPDSLLAEKGDYRALHGQGDPRAARRRRAYHRALRRHGGERGVKPFGWPSTRRRSRGCTIVACGTASYAGMIARYCSSAGRGCRSRSRSPREYRYREPPVDAGGAGDCRLAVRRDRRHAGGAALGAKTGARRRSASSTCRIRAMARLSRRAAPTHAGPEIGVASTKAFTCPARRAGGARHRPGASARRRSTRLTRRRLSANSVADPGPPCRGVEAGSRTVRARRRRSPARGTCSTSAAAPTIPWRSKGALKLKEISYIHAEGYAAGETEARSNRAHRRERCR